MASIKKLEPKLTYRIIEECNDIIEEYDLEKEARFSSELIEGLKDSKEEGLNSIYILGKLKKEITRDRKKQMNIGRYKIYCILKGIEFVESEMMDADVQEVETIYNNFQNGIKSGK